MPELVKDLDDKEFLPLAKRRDKKQVKAGRRKNRAIS